jgi:hypothetical protein
VGDGERKEAWRKGRTGPDVRGAEMKEFLGLRRAWVRRDGVG